jgi:hypothetical protein
LGRSFTGDVDYVKRGEGWWKSNKENVEGQAIHDSLGQAEAEDDLSINYGPDQLPETSRRHRGSCRCQGFIVRTTRGRQPSAFALDFNKCSKAKTRSRLGAP